MVLGLEFIAILTVRCFYVVQKQKGVADAMIKAKTNTGLMEPVSQYMTDPALLKRITVRQEVFGGKPIIRDMRILVKLILHSLAQGVTPEAIIEDYSDLEPDDIRACIAYAQAVIARDTLDAVSVRARGEHL
jgi:uncharacterized protein (DUF433 family)